MKTFYGSLIVIVLIASCSRIMHVTDIQESNINIQELDSDPGIADLIKPYKDVLDAEMGTEIGICETTLTKQKPESTLGNWFTDLMEQASADIFVQPVDFVVQNFGGLRIGNIAKGSVTKRKIYELMPFDNTLVSVEMDVKELTQLINQMAASGGWPNSSSLNYTIIDEMASDIKVKTAPLDDSRTYRVAMPDYIANGGNDAIYLQDNPREDPGLLVRDLAIMQIIKNTEKGKNISAQLDRRVKHKN